MKEYILVNLDDFHKNQTNLRDGILTQIRVIKAKNFDDVKAFTKRWYPKIAWVAISKEHFDKHIIYKEV